MFEPFRVKYGLWAVL